MANPPQLKTISVISFLILNATLAFAAESKTPAGTFEIFADGQKYKNFQEYKDHRINKMRQEAIEEDLRVVDQKQNKVSQQSSSPSDPAAKDSTVSSSPADPGEIQQLLNALLKKRGEGEKLIFNSQTMKTVTVTPDGMPAQKDIPVQTADHVQADIQKPDSQKSK